MGSSEAGPGLDQLLAQLLRLLSREAVTGAGSWPAAKESTGEATGQPAGSWPAANEGAGDAAQQPAVVSASEARALAELLAAHGIAQGDLAAALGLEKSTVSRLAAGLERKGWIRRGRDERNHRYLRLYLTPQGALVANRVWQAWRSRQERVLAGLSGEERRALAVGLRGLLRELLAEGPASGPPATAPGGH